MRCLGFRGISGCARSLRKNGRNRFFRAEGPVSVGTLVKKFKDEIFEERRGDPVWRDACREETVFSSIQEKVDALRCRR